MPCANDAQPAPGTAIAVLVFGGASIVCGFKIACLASCGLFLLWPSYVSCESIVHCCKENKTSSCFFDLQSALAAIPSVSQ
ncbi:hypothetical protein V8C26DRAFT_400943 [Trichoderma gracile]